MNTEIFLVFDIISYEERVRILIDKIKKLRHNLNAIDELERFRTVVIDLYAEKISFYLLNLWLLSPIIVLFIIKISYDSNQDYFIIRELITIEWNVLLQQIGFIGFILIVLSLIISLREQSNELIKNIKYYNSSIFFLVLLFLWSIVSTVLSDDIILSLYGTQYRRDGLISYFSYAGIFFCGYLINSEQLVKWILNLFTLVSTLLSWLMIANIDFLNKFLYLQPKSAIFFNINHFGYYLCMAIMASVGLILQKSSRTQIFIYTTMYSVLILALVMNRSFGPYLAIISGLFFLSVIIWRFKKEIKNRLLIIIFIFLFISITFNSTNGFLKNEIFSLSNSVTEIVQNTKSSGKAGSGRWELWVHGVYFSTEKPMFGYGPDNLAARYLEEDISQDRPHNVFIQIAASLGFPALIFYLYALLIHFKKVWNNRNKMTILNITVNSIAFTYLVSSFFGNSMFYTTPFYVMFIGIAIGNIDNNSEKTQEI